MKVSKQKRLLCVFIIISLLSGVAALLTVGALSMSGDEYTCDAAWQVSEASAAVNTGTAIEGLKQGDIIKVPGVNFGSGTYDAISLNAAGVGFQRVEVYIDNVASQKRLATVEFGASGSIKKYADIDFAALSSAPSGVHDVYFRLASGDSLNLKGFRLGHKIPGRPPKADEVFFDFNASEDTGFSKFHDSKDVKIKNQFNTDAIYPTVASSVNSCVVVKLAASAPGEVFTELKLTLNARSLFNHGSYLKFNFSTVEPPVFGTADEVPPPDLDAAAAPYLADFLVDLTDKAAGREFIYVRINLYSASGEAGHQYVHSIKATGKSEGTPDPLESFFEFDAATDTDFSKFHAASDVKFKNQFGTDAIYPTAASNLNSYVVVKIEPSNPGAVFTELSLKLTARSLYAYGSYLKFNFSTEEPPVFGTADEAPPPNLDDAAAPYMDDFTVDLTDKAAGKKFIYARIMLYSATGDAGHQYLHGITAEGKSEVTSFFEFDASADTDFSKFYSTSEVKFKNQFGTDAIFPTIANNLNSYVVVKLEPAVPGEMFTKLELKLTARSLYAHGSYLKFNFSTADPPVFGTDDEVPPPNLDAAAAPYMDDFTVDLTAKAAGKQFIYVRIMLYCSIGDGGFQYLHAIKAEGKSEDPSQKPLFEFDASEDTDFSKFYATSDVKFKNQFGTDAIFPTVANNLNSYVTVKLEPAVPGETFTELGLTLTARSLYAHGAYLKFNFSTAEPPVFGTGDEVSPPNLDSAAEPYMDDFFVDLTDKAAGKEFIYVRIMLYCSIGDGGFQYLHAIKAEGKSAGEAPAGPIPVLKDEYINANTVVMKSGDVKYNSGPNAGDINSVLYSCADDEYLNLYVVNNVRSDYVPQSPFFLEMNIDPDPAGEADTGPAQTNILLAGRGDIRYYYSFGVAPSAESFGWSLNKGSKAYVRETVLENNRTEYVLELKIPRPAGQTEFRIGFAIIEGGLVTELVPGKSSENYEGMKRFSYEDSEIPLIDHVSDVDVPVGSSWSTPGAYVEDESVRFLHGRSVVTVPGVNFGARGARYIQLRGTAAVSGSVDIYAGGLDEASKLGSCLFPESTGGSYTAKTSLKKAAYGTQTVYLVASGGLVNFDAFKLSGNFPVYETVDGYLDGLYTANHCFDMAAGSAYQVGKNAIGMNSKLYYYVNDDFLYLYAVSDVPEGSELSSLARMEIFIDPDPSANPSSGTSYDTIATNAAGNTESWVALNFTGENPVWGIPRSATYAKRIYNEGGRSYFALEVRIARPANEKYAQIGFHAMNDATIFSVIQRAGSDSSHYGNMVKVYYRDPIVVDGVKEETWTEDTRTRMEEGGEWQVGANPSHASTDIYYEFDDNNVSFFAETKTQGLPAQPAQMKLFVDTDPFKNEGQYADMAAASSDVDQSESGFYLDLKAQPAAGITGSLPKGTQVAYTSDGPDAEGCYTFRLEASVPRVPGETYFQYGFAQTQGGAQVFNLAKTAAAPESYDTATKIFYMTVTPMSWINLLGKHPVWQQGVTNLNNGLLKSGKVVWSFPFTAESAVTPIPPSSKPSESSSASSQPSTSSAPDDENALLKIVKEAITQSDGTIILELDDTDCVLTPEMLGLLESAGKPVTIRILSAGSLSIEWRFERITSLAENFDPRLSAAENSGIPEGRIGQVISLAHTGALPGTATVMVPVTAGLKAGDKLLLYRFNTETKRMELSEITVAVMSDGFLKFTLEQGGIYAAILDNAGLDNTKDSVDTNEKDDPALSIRAIMLIIAGALVLAGGTAALILYSRRKRSTGRGSRQ